MKDAPLIAVDIGNTSLKCGRMAPAIGPGIAGLPRVEKLLQVSTSAGDLEVLRAWLPESPVRWCIASVQRQGDRRLTKWISDRRPQDQLRLLRPTDIPLRIDVDYPERVGVDRLAAAYTADRLRAKGRPAIVVDAGTAVTVDVVSADSAFLGGAILPGMWMSARSLSLDTDLLPMVAVDAGELPPPIGRNTEAAIRSGVYYGLAGAVKELVAQMQAKLGGAAEVFVGGGGADILLPPVLNDSQHVPQLVLAGVALVAERLG